MIAALYTASYWFLMFMAYSFFGWAYESILCSITEKKLVNRGFLSGPVCPVYGCGAMFVLLTVGGVQQVLPLFLSAAVVTCTVEYITSWLMEKMFHAKWWDYSSFRFNLNGRICLLGALAFGVLSLLLIKFLHPRLTGAMSGFSHQAVVITALCVLAVFCTDIAFTVHHLLGMNGRMAELQKALDAYKAQAAQRSAELRLLMEESTAELRLRGENATGELREMIERRELARQRRLDELRGQLSLRFEESEFNTLRLRAIQSARLWQDRRIMRAFPRTRSTRYAAALELLRRGQSSGKDDKSKAS